VVDVPAIEVDARQRSHCTSRASTGRNPSGERITCKDNDLAINAQDGAGSRDAPATTSRGGGGPLPTECGGR
jgi:hypothetical protein